MPHVIVKLWPGKSEQQKARLARLPLTRSKTMRGAVLYGPREANEPIPSMSKEKQDAEA